MKAKPLFVVYTPDGRFHWHEVQNASCPICKAFKDEEEKELERLRQEEDAWYAAREKHEKKQRQLKAKREQERKQRSKIARKRKKLREEKTAVAISKYKTGTQSLYDLDTLYADEAIAELPSVPIGPEFAANEPVKQDWKSALHRTPKRMDAGCGTVKPF